MTPTIRLAVSLNLLLCLFSPRAFAVSAEYLYRHMQQSIYQIQVIDLATDKKSSIGSGFQVARDGLIATNYHVVSEYIQQPDKYRLEYVASDDSRGPLKIMDVDVIHDLALVKGNLQAMPLSFAASRLDKGAHIYSIGNPQDLGMSIVEGTFNGNLDKSLYQKILFSGSLNPGMSGGPALNDRGELIGINVSTAGNELSFLVPAKFLKRLMQHYVSDGAQADLLKRIEQQLLDNQDRVMKRLLKSDWKTMTLGNVTLPAELAHYFKCWGQSNTDNKRQYQHSYSACASPDEIYLSRHFNTGEIDFRYDWYEKDQLNTTQFYHLYQDKFAGAYPTNRASRDDVSNYRCYTNFVTLSHKDWKVATCARRYKKFPRLYDVSLSMAMVSAADRGINIQLNISGISKERSQQMLSRYMGKIQWRN